MYQFVLPILFATSVLAAAPIPLPSEFKTCSRNAPDFNICLKSAIQSAMLTLVKGSRPLGVLPIDPLQLSTLGIHQGSGPVAINLDFVKPSIEGLGDIKIESVDAQLNGDVKTLKLTISTTKSLKLSGQYTIDGKVLVLPISGSGNAEINFLGADATLTFTGKTVSKDGNQYLVFSGIQLSLNPRSMKMNFQNLFNGDKALGDNMNMFLNENWYEVYTELKGSVEQALGTTFVEIAKRMFSKVPYDRVFLP